MKMVQKESIKWQIFLILSLMTFQFFGASQLKTKTHDILMQVNKNWEGIAKFITHTYTPQSEQELVQLHLMNVVSYLEEQPLAHLSKTQQQNRHYNIATLKEYCLAGEYPINILTDYRTPIFIDDKQVHCAVGYLLQVNGLESVAQTIAQHQLLAYLGDIESPQLAAWQKTCGLSMFELALIQPTYGPPIPVCAAPSPIEWQTVTQNSNITQLVSSANDSTIYGISQMDELGLQYEIMSYTPHSKQWTSLGEAITGQILELIFLNDQPYISALLPDAKYPHQLLKLKENKWQKVAHFNGNISDMEVFQNNLYVNGNFTTVNDSISASFVVITPKTIHPFAAVGLKNTPFEHIKASQTALFLTSGSGIYKFKNDTLNYISYIKYYQYFTNLSMDAEADTLLVASLNIPGYNKYHDMQERTSSINNMLYGQDYPYSSMNFTKSKMINGHMVISGDFRASTLIPQINDERHLMQCPEKESAHWFGEGIIYQYNNMFYPILKDGIVLDFIQLQDQIYILKKDGSFAYTTIATIEKEIIEVRKRGNL